MARGAVYYHSQFKFHDGQTGQKIFIVLNDPKQNEPYLFVKTTSNLRNKKYITECNPDKGEFFFPANLIPIFKKDTVVQLLEIYEATSQEFLNAHLHDNTLVSLGQLSTHYINLIVNCLKKLKEDIPENYFSLIVR